MPPGPPVAVDVHAHLVPRGLLGLVQAGEFPGLAVTDDGDQPVLTAGAGQPRSTRPWPSRSRAAAGGCGWSRPRTCRRARARQSLEPLWTRLADLGLRVLLHPPVNGSSRAFMPPILQNVAGRPIDTSSTVLQLMATGLFGRLPGLRVIVVHGGGFLPYQAHRLDGLVRAGLLARTRMAEAPSSLLRRLFYDTVTLDPLSVEFLVGRVGASQVLLGSDTPFPITDPDPVGTIRSANLSAAVRRGICCDNARALAWRS